MPFSSPSALSLMPKILGMDGPVMSASSIAVFRPRRFMVTASRDVTMDLPTPPLPDTTPITFLMLDSACGASWKSSGCCREAQLLLQVLQSCVQFSLMGWFLRLIYPARRFICLRACIHI